ncbi:MAG: methyltransferase domain-containing protein [Bacteroidetes bacterium]|nr:methyltransferase domain-containing protein [Bacteroidota bacterium]
MHHQPASGDEPRLRPSGYASRLYEIGYGSAAPFYDLIVWWGSLPLGGEKTCRRLFARWLDPQPGQRVVSLCCGTGSMERALLERTSEIEITAIDLGAGQLARARRKDPAGRIDYRVGDASDTGLPEACFDRVMITLALHEMPRSLRLSVLMEARRLCTPGGRVLAIEHARPEKTPSRLGRALWWFFWVPGNPEVPTSRDLQQHGLDNEMREAGLTVEARFMTRPDWIEGIVALKDG